MDSRHSLVPVACLIFMQITCTRASGNSKIMDQYPAYLCHEASVGELNLKRGIYSNPLRNAYFFRCAVAPHIGEVDETELQPERIRRNKRKVDVNYIDAY